MGEKTAVQILDETLPHVAGAHEGTARLEGPQARQVRVLTRLDRRERPRVIRAIDQDFGAEIGERARDAGKGALVADEQAEAIDGKRQRGGREVTDALRQKF